MFHPTRAGCRGGRDQFNWEELKDKKDRMNYLGNSVRTPHRGIKDLYWYARDSSSRTSSTSGKKGNKETDLQREIREQKEKEAKLMGFYLQKGFGNTPEEEVVQLNTESGNKEKVEKKEKRKRTSNTEDGDKEKKSKRSKKERKDKA